MPFDHLMIKEFRKAIGLTQEKLAKRLDVPQSTVARWESGRITPNAAHIGLMCDLGRVEGIDPDFLFPPYSRYPQEAAIKLKNNPFSKKPGSV